MLYFNVVYNYTIFSNDFMYRNNASFKINEGSLYTRNKLIQNYLKYCLTLNDFFCNSILIIKNK